MSKQELTKEQILAFEPGLQMDKAIADKVMGWKMREYQDNLGVTFGSDWIDGETIVCEVEEFNPSIGISDVWQVEEQIKKLGLTVEYTGALKQVVLGTGEYVGMFDFIHSTPEQRCKATLLAVMGGSGNE